VLRYVRDPRGFLARCVERHGDPFTVPTPEGPAVVATEPSTIRTIFAANPDSFDMWASRIDLLAPIVGETSLLLVDGERHKRDRKLQSSPFHAARMRTYAKQMAEITARHLADVPDSGEFVAQGLAEKITREVILRTVFGVTDRDRLTDLLDVLAERDDAAKPLVLFFKQLRRTLGGRGPWARFVRATERLDRLVYDEIRRHRERGDGEDVLSLMISARYDDDSRMTDKELRDALLTLVIAGHETTAIAIAWALYWIHRDRNVLTRLRDELDRTNDDADFAKLPYLDAVCQETLRMDPIVGMVPYHLRKALTIGGYEVPAGTQIVVAPSVLHMRPDLYPDPRTFRPERFLERKYSPFEYVPFGGGARRCIGAAFASYQMKVVVATLLRHRELALVSDALLRPVRLSVLLGPEGGVPMRSRGPARSRQAVAAVAT
jgi:cytochrome P450